MAREETGEALRSIFAHWERHGFGRWAAVHKNEPVGNSRENQEVEIAPELGVTPQELARILPSKERNGSCSINEWKELFCKICLERGRFPRLFLSSF